LILVTREAQRVISEKSNTPKKNASIIEIVFFFLYSFLVKIARKRYIIHIIERRNVTTPKIVLTSCFNNRAISAGLIPKPVKKLACPGLKTIYARKAPKNMSATRRIAQIIRKKSPVFKGFFFVFPFTSEIILDSVGEIVGISSSINVSDRRSTFCVDIDSTFVDSKISPSSPLDELSFSVLVIRMKIINYRIYLYKKHEKNK